MSHHHHDEHKAQHLAITITKLALRAAAVAAAFCLVKEVHRVHKSIEAHK